MGLGKGSAGFELERSYSGSQKYGCEFRASEDQDKGPRLATERRSRGLKLVIDGNALDYLLFTKRKLLTKKKIDNCSCNI